MHDSARHLSLPGHRAAAMARRLILQTVSVMERQYKTSFKQNVSKQQRLEAQSSKLHNVRAEEWI
jgi:hypothetical protein